MTKGFKSYDYTTYVPSPLPGDPNSHSIGRLGIKRWDGIDSIKPATPREFWRTRPIAPREFRSVETSHSLRHARQGKKYAPSVAKPKSIMVERPARKSNVPKWLLRMNLPPNNYTLQVADVEHGMHAVTRKSTGKTVIQAVLNMPQFEEYLDPAFEYKVIAKLSDVLYGSGFSPSVFLAEGQQSMEMISNSATRLRLGIRALCRGNPRGILNALEIAAPSKQWVKQVGKLKKARRATANGVPAAVGTPRTEVARQGTVFKAMSSLWLEVQYGWLPLLQDAEAAGQWLAYAVNGVNMPQRFQVSSKVERSLKLVGWSATSPASWSRCREIRRLKLTVYGVTKAPAYLPNLASLAGVAWEKVPWSFAVDWFVPIGSYLAACSTQRSLSGTFVRTESIDREYSHPVSFDPNWAYLGCVLGNERQHNFDLTRRVSSTLPVTPPFTDFLSKSQGYKSWRHAANAIALLVQPLHKHGFVN